MMAFVETDAAGPKVGDVRSAFVLTMGDHPVRLRGVASFIEEIVPLAGGERKARFAVAGEVEQQPWQFLIDENGVIEWQKSYRVGAGATGEARPDPLAGVPAHPRRRLDRHRLAAAPAS